MNPDTYVITTRYADYEQPATATEYVSVVGRAYATARKEAAYLALNWLRSTPHMSRHETDVPARWVTVEIWEGTDDTPSATIEIDQDFSGDYRTVVSMLKTAEGL
jgi:hypothetical protein